MSSFLTMLQLRPYVFGFMVAFLFLAVRLWGWRRTFLWLGLGYGIAWASEAMSIRTGFPYGWYFYKYENLRHDILLAGVPIWDSLSYTFLIFAGYTIVKYRWPRLSPAATAITGGVATMLLDIMIDPVSNLGERWFLGSIYYYPTGGAHFGVPISNYIGWGFVAWVVISMFQRLTEGSVRPEPVEGQSGGSTSSPRTGVNWFYPAFYIAIGIFNTAIAFWIGAPAIGIANSVMLLVISGIVFTKPRSILIALFVLFIYSPTSDASPKQKLPHFEDGDLIFLDLDCGAQCDAIEEVTLRQFKVEGPRLSHVGILHRENKKWMVIEAWDGVQDTPLEDVLARAGNRPWYWGRMNLLPQMIKNAVTEAKAQIGQPYNGDFVVTSPGKYCSELVADVFNDVAQPHTMFLYRPMTFGNIKDPHDTAAQTWRDYFTKRHQQIPEGKPGISPLGIFLSETITTHPGGTQ